jgi:RimJ/RimL family protein N-acetyltransferase
MLEGEKVRLRAYSKEDIPKARAYLNDPDTGSMMRMRILFPLRMEDEEKWYQSLDANSSKEYDFAIEAKDNGAYLGGCGVHGIDPKNRLAMVGLFLGKEHCGQGYGTDVLRVLVDFCFKEINLNRIQLGVFSFNKRAIRCYEKVGFRTEGVLRQEIYRQGKYHDTILMALLRSEWEQRKRRKTKRA